MDYALSLIHIYKPPKPHKPHLSSRINLYNSSLTPVSYTHLDAALDMEKEDPYRVGVSVGNGIGSLGGIEREHKRLLEKGPSKVNPLFVPLVISNMAAGNVSIAFGLKGKSINVVTACATGTNSIGEAFRSIQYGEADVMVAGGTEGAICPLGIAGFTSLTALSSESDPDVYKRQRCNQSGVPQS